MRYQQMKNHYDVIIIGSGPAGLAVGSELSRQLLAKIRKNLLLKTASF